jgi:hypothetical protein
MFNIIKATPAATHLDFDLTGAGYDGNPHGVVVTVNSAYTGMGAITVKYTGTNGTTYGPAATPPTDRGTYAVTVDIAAGSNFNAVTGLLLPGDFSIGKVTPTENHLDFTLPANVTYDGTPQSVAVALISGYSGMGAITVKYTGTNGTTYGPSATPPVNAGTYAVTADIAAGSNFNAVTGLPLTGDFIIDKATPDIEALGVTADLSKAPVRITVPGSVTGLGAITVKYNGSTTVPGAPGTYEVTIDIAEGDNYTATTGIVIGYLSIPEPPSIHREVILPQIPGATTDPPAGRYYVESGEDFVFTLYPDAENSQLTLFVTAGRVFDENGGGVTWTANEDGSYTVRIRQIRENVTISFGFATGNSVIDGGTRVWSHAGALYTSAARDSEARIYRLSGVLLKIIPLAAGETVRTPLPRGFYIIASGRDRYKVRIF